MKRLLNRLLHNTLFFGFRACGNNGMALLFGWALFGFHNTMLFLYAAGFTGAVRWEIACAKERRWIRERVLERFGVPVLEA